MHYSSDFQIFEDTDFGDVNNTLEPHSHTFLEILFMLGGDCELCIQDKMYKIYRNQLIIIPDKVKHKFFSGSIKVKNIMLTIPVDFIDKSFYDDFNRVIFKRAIKLDSEELKHIRGIFMKILEEYNCSDKYSSELIKNHLMEAFIFLLRHVKQNVFFENESSLTDRITVYLLDHYNEDISLTSVSQVFYISRPYLSKVFKAKTGRGFNEYLNKLRIEQAKMKLKTSSLSITEIAHCCGFNDSNYFSKAFKKAEGISPYEYRNS